MVGRTEELRMTRTFTFTHHIERSFTDALGWEGEAEIELQVT